MPSLPALTVSQAHYDRIVAAFPGATLVDKAAAYKNWLTNNLIAFVLQAETVAIEAALAAQHQTQVDAVRANLPPQAEMTYLAQATVVIPVTPPA